MSPAGSDPAPEPSVSVDETPSASGSATQAGLAYLPGLDGLRAFSVIAVMLYHAGLPVYGGFLGVESFFVISGFLITALLLHDWQRHGKVRLGVFWLRRARRLLPALIVLLAATLLFAIVWLRNELPELRSDTLAALGYVTNWYLIASGQSYFDAAGRPPLLQHLWSLAIEEQFYLIWPLLFAAGMRFLRPRGTLALTLLGAAASVGLMVALYDPGADPSRIYYGTDTRASGLLLGAALAMLWSPGRMSALAGRGASLALDAIGTLALGGLVAATLILNEQHPLLYRGGLHLVAVGTAIAVAAAVHPASRLLPWVLELPPLRWIGVRSYSLYLWHWPIFMLTRPGVDFQTEGWVLQLARFAAVFAVAALAYQLVELPIRRGALGRLWSAFRARPRPEASMAPQPWRQRLLPGLAGGLLGLSVAAIGATLAAGLVPGASVAQAVTMTPAPTVAPPTAVASSALTPAAPEAATVAPTGAAASDTDDVQPISPVLAEELQRLLDSTVADGTIPGAVLSVRLPGGAIWSGSSGIADRETEAPMEVATQVRIGSLSKMFTAVVVLQLAEEGAIGLDEPVSTWLPDVLPDDEQITVRQLLQHTSGLYDYLEDRRFVAEAYAEPERIWEPQELVDYAAEFPPLFEPGTADSWDYSSTNYVILGMLVEEVTGDTLADALKSRIFEPLGLEHTFSVPPDAVTGPQAHGYSENTDQSEVALSFAFATANIVTTVEDLRRFGEALFEEELLSSETMAEMQRFVDGKGQYDMPALAYGLGLMRNELPIDVSGDGQADDEADLVLGHIGGFGGFRGALWYAAERDILIALDLNQAAIDPNDLATRVLETVVGYQGG
jgi:peptidoglycan/LPS O-acetylase OafA/YrhL/CubicO group peptidase (beta-lactamase class C family)